MNRHTSDLTETEICWMYITPEISLQNLHNFMGQTCHTFISGLCLQFSSHSLSGLQCRSKSYTDTTFWQQKEYFSEEKLHLFFVSAETNKNTRLRILDAIYYCEWPYQQGPLQFANSLNFFHLFFFSGLLFLKATWSLDYCKNIQHSNKCLIKV